MNNELIKTKNFSALVVDDNQVNLYMAAQLIKATGAETDTASGGMEAIGKVKGKNYDIIFLDYIMPDMDGIETAKKLREAGYIENKLCIISLSVNNDENYVKLFKEAGMQDFLPKPIVPEQLNAILKKWLPPKKLCIKKQNNAEFLIKALKCIDGLNPESILEKNGGDCAAYEACLDLFVRNVPNIIKILPAKLDDGKKFAAAVRGAKQICLNIGADKSAEEASALEATATAGDMNFCEENVGGFISGLIHIREALNITISHM